MTSPRELPQLVGDLAQISKEYILQETVEPAKSLGRLAGFGLAAGLLFAIGSFLLAVGGLRWLQAALPTGELWSAGVYGIAATASLVVAAIIVWRVTNE